MIGQSILKFGSNLRQVAALFPHFQIISTVQDVIYLPRRNHHFPTAGASFDKLYLMAHFHHKLRRVNDGVWLHFSLLRENHRLLYITVLDLEKALTVCDTGVSGVHCEST